MMFVVCLTLLDVPRGHDGAWVIQELRLERVNAERVCSSVDDAAMALHSPVQSWKVGWKVRRDWLCLYEDWNHGISPCDVTIHC